MLNVAFKEWASICQALSSGQQSIILRKGGISERDGLFRPEYPQFWLYPTFLHQQEQGINTDRMVSSLVKPDPGTIDLQHFVVVESVRFVDRIETLLRLADLHIWTEATVLQRFSYRTPGVYVLGVRVFSLPKPHRIIEEPAFAGCKTWVELREGLSTDQAAPVLSDHEAESRSRLLAERLSE